MIYLTLQEAIVLYEDVIKETGGMFGVQNLGALESSLAQPYEIIYGVVRFPNIEDKAAALIFSIVRNHPFVDGNKRAGKIMMEKFLELNGFEISSTVDEQEQIILQLASGEMRREEITEWLKSHIVEKGK